MNIVFYPVIKRTEDFGELLARAAWYLPDFAGNTVVFPIADDSLEPGPVPEAMGVECTPSFEVEKRVVRNNPEAISLLNSADLVLMWNDELNIMERYNMAGVTCRIMNVSKASEKMRHEAYHNAILRQELLPEAEREAVLAENHERLKAVVPELRREKAYVFGTGPSLADAMDHDFSDGNTIICNTIVRNKPLLERIRPTCIVAADPALHFGVSRYAASFRKNLVEAMETYGSYLFLPMGYHALFVRQYPHIKDKVFGVPVVPAAMENVSTDLTERYQIACYANILTMFLLPLGATLGKEVHVYGCDGRRPTGVPDGNASPFWEHHKDSEYEDEYHTLMECHPGFFMLNLKEWYDEHCDNVGLLVEKIEAADKRVVTRSRSFIPSLTRRLVPELRDRYLPMLEADQGPEADPVYSYIRDTRMRRTYRVSVFVSLYNAERFMAAIMENLTSQTLYRQGQMEIVLIDSNSPQNERAVAARFMDVHEHVFYGRTHERETVYAAFNRGITQARGEYVMNLDADNRLRNDAVELFADYLDSHPDVGLVYGNQYISQIENEEFHNHVRFGFCRRAAYDPSMVLHGFYFGSEMMWRKALHDEVGLYREDLIVAGDYDMVCKLAEAVNFAHVDEFFGMYTKNLSGVEFSNLELCAEESAAVCREYDDRLPAPVDPPRVHVHFPLREKGSEEYIAIVCHTMSFDKSIESTVNKIFENLSFPHIIYTVDQNSSPTTQASIAHLTGKGVVVPGENLLPGAQALFDLPMAYMPAIRFSILAHGRTAVLEKDFMSMSRPALTGYFRAVYEELTADMRNEAGKIDPLKVPALCDHHEIARLDLEPHFVMEGDTPELPESDLAVFIQHFCPEDQEDTFRESLKRCIASIRSQKYGGRVTVIVSDDGSPWSRELGEGAGHGIRAYAGDDLKRFDCLSDIDADCYIYKNRTGYFSKGVLWNAATRLANANRFVFMDDDHFFRTDDALTLYAEHLDDYQLVVGCTRSYRFMDVDGVYHIQHMGFDSPVVQGSNFGIRRETLEAVGGFDDRTFIWGTGDDPVLFWKLYQQLRPTDYQPQMQACYLDAIETENPYSGRWQTDCRVNRELFTRDFLRLYRAHPNTNPSRMRASWMTHIPKPGAPATVTPMAAGDVGCTVIVPHLGDEWKTRTTVVSIIEQRIAEPVEILVPHAPGNTPDAGLIPATARLIECSGEALPSLVKAGMDAAANDVLGLYMPGTIMAQKTLKPVIHLFDREGADLVMGARVHTDDTCVETRRVYPVTPTRQNALPFLADWAGDHPFFLRRTAAPDFGSDEAWLFRLLFGTAENGTVFSRTNIFSYHGETADSTPPTEAVSLLDTLFPDDRETYLAGAMAHARSADRVDHQTTQQNLVEWRRDFDRALRDMADLHAVLMRDSVTRVALCGTPRDVERLLEVWFRAVTVVGVVANSDTDRAVGDLPLLTADQAKERCDAVVLATPGREEHDFNTLRSEGLTVYAMRRRFGHQG